MNSDRVDILYVITDLEVGGVPLHLARLASEMQSRGHRVLVASLAPAGPVGDRLRAAGIEVRDCRGRSGWDVRVIWRLTTILRETHPRIVHAMLFHANLAARLAARHAGIPAKRLLCEIQTVEVDQRWHLTLDRWTHRRCRCVIGNSPSVVEHLARAGLSRDCLKLIRGGINADAIMATPPAPRAALPVPADVPIIFWAGRLDPVKGLGELIAAFAIIAGESPAHLVLAGTGAYRKHVESLIQKLRVETRTHLLGARTDVPAIMKIASVFAFPSRTEGLPNALLEAMAAGCPIVTTQAPGCRDLIVNGQNGLTVPSGDVPALAAAISELLHDSARGALLASCALADVRYHWDIREMFDAYAALYREVLHDGGASG